VIVAPAFLLLYVLDQRRLLPEEGLEESLEEAPTPDS
jgi:hypothetical protein